MSRPVIIHNLQDEKRKKSIRNLEERMKRLEDTYQKTIEWMAAQGISEPQSRPHQAHQ